MAFLKTNEKKQLFMGGIKRIIPYIHRTGQMVLDILLPPKCLKCGSRVVDAHNICPDCWKDLYLFRIRNVRAVVSLLAANLEMIIRFLVKHFVRHAKNPLIRLIRLTPPSDMMMRADQ